MHIILRHGNKGILSRRYLDGHVPQLPYRAPMSARTIPNTTRKRLPTTKMTTSYILWENSIHSVAQQHGLRHVKAWTWFDIPFVPTCNSTNCTTTLSHERSWCCFEDRQACFWVRCKRRHSRPRSFEAWSSRDSRVGTKHASLHRLLVSPKWLWLGFEMQIILCDADHEEEVP